MDKINKISKIVMIVLMAIGVILFIRLIAHGDEAISEDSSVAGSLVDPDLYITYVMLIAATVLSIAFPLAYLIKHPSEAKGPLIGVAVLVAIYFISYASASSEVMPTYLEGTTESQSKYASTGLIALYIMLFLTVFSIIATEVYKLFK